VLATEGRDLSRCHGHGRGRLNITVIVDIPQQISPRQHRLCEQLRAEDAQVTDLSA
jgi:DnaJ-class molecular chaperone